MFLASGTGGPVAWMNRPLTAWLTGLALLSAILLVDEVAPAEVEFSAFYLLPVIFLAWSRGTREGLAMGLLAGAVWYGHDVQTGRLHASEWLRLWDEVNHLLSYLLAAWVVGALRRQVLVQQGLNQQLSAAMAEVRELEGLLPVCAWCHNIRDDEGRWHTMEVFLSTRTKASTTHGICPNCSRNMLAGEDLGGGEP